LGGGEKGSLHFVRFGECSRSRSREKTGIEGIIWKRERGGKRRKRRTSTGVRFRKGKTQTLALVGKGGKRGSKVLECGGSFPHQSGRASLFRLREKKKKKGLPANGVEKKEKEGLLAGRGEEKWGPYFPRPWGNRGPKGRRGESTNSPSPFSLKKKSGGPGQAPYSHLSPTKKKRKKISLYSVWQGERGSISQVREKEE